MAILSGANMNFDRLRFVAERAEVGEAREALLGVTIPERPGAFREFCAAIGPRVVTEFNYRLAGREAAHIFVGLKTSSREDAQDVAAGLRGRGYATARPHRRRDGQAPRAPHGGGRARRRGDERLYRFEFPERPGALMQFLETLGGRWNISLFHYRNHGADFGRVLCAFEVPEAEMPELPALPRAASATRASRGGQRGLRALPLRPLTDAHAASATKRFFVASPATKLLRTTGRGFMRRGRRP